MTLLELRTELWQDLGEPPNLDPADATQKAQLNSWINRAYKKILFWKFPDGRQARWAALEGKLFAKTVVVTGTLASATVSTLVLDASAGANNDQYNGWLVKTTQGVALIVDYDGGTKTATLHTSFSSVPSGAYSLYKNFLRFCAPGAVGASENIVLDPVSQILDVRKVTNIASAYDLETVVGTETFAGNILVHQSQPYSYFRRGDDLVFEGAIDEQVYLQIEYTRLPPDLSADSDEPELPKPLHEAVLLWATWRGFRWSQEWAAAYSTKRDLMEFMATSKLPRDTEMEREDGQAEMEG